MENTISNKPSFAFCYGFMEGRLHSRGLKNSLTKSGFEISSLKQADIIIAHSAGCCLISKKANPKLVIYVGMPLVMARPKRQWINVSFKGLLRDNSLNNISMHSKNSLQALANWRRNAKIISRPLIGKPQIFPKAKTVFIANRYDDWPRGPTLDKFLGQKPWDFISLPGNHEDIWKNPKRYADIMEQYAKRLLG